MSLFDQPHAGVQRVVSGGQTGVDRAALEVAIALEIEHGGWCPRGRLAEDGSVPMHFQLRETESPLYHVRTERNVTESDGTLILYRGQLSGGTKLTQRLARAAKRPHCVVDLVKAPALRPVLDWLQREQIAVLNVAGPRESASPGIRDQAANFIYSLLVAQRRVGTNLGASRCETIDLA